MRLVLLLKEDLACLVLDEPGLYRTERRGVAGEIRLDRFDPDAGGVYIDVLREALGLALDEPSRILVVALGQTLFRLLRDGRVA